MTWQQCITLMAMMLRVTDKSLTDDECIATANGFFDKCANRLEVEELLLELGSPDETAEDNGRPRCDP